MRIGWVRLMCVSKREIDSANKIELSQVKTTKEKERLTIVQNINSHTRFNKFVLIMIIYGLNLRENVFA